MLRVTMFDLGLTLIDASDRPFPHAKQALRAIQSFVTADGKPLQTCLVSDFEMPKLPADPIQVVGIFQKYLRILDKTGLRELFEPVDKRVTLSTHAGVNKPDKKIFATALRRLGTRVGSLSECLFVTENEAHIQAARDQLGMQTLQFRSDRSSRFDFDDWSQAPLLVAHLLSAPKAGNAAAALKTHLSEAHDFEVDSEMGPPSEGTQTLRGKLWQRIESPDLGDLSGVMVGLPTEGEVTLGPKGEAKAVHVVRPTTDQVAEATSFVKSLARHQGVAGAGPSAGTHRVEVDERGRRKLVRKRYSAL